MNQNPSEKIALVGCIDPDAYTAATYVSDYVSMADFITVLAIVKAGTMGTDGTINAKLVQATASDGTGAKDITGKAITELTEAGTDSDKQAIINCRAAELDVANAFIYVAISMTVAVATCDAGADLIGCDPRYAPASDNDLASVAEIVA